MTTPIDAGQYILGKIDAVELLAASLAAHLSPAVASVLLAQCATLREKAAPGAALSDYEKGFLSTGSTVLTQLKLVADVQKMNLISPDERH